MQIKLSLIFAITLVFCLGDSMFALADCEESSLFEVVYEAVPNVDCFDSSDFEIDLGYYVLTSCTDSNGFSISFADPGGLIGTVTDLQTNDPIVSATVSIPGESPAQTNENGWFAIAELPAGELDVLVAATGYHDTTRTVTVGGGSVTSTEIRLVPDSGFGVVEVRGKHCDPSRQAYYLHGVPLTETFTALIDWGSHGVGEVFWTAPQGAYHDICTSGQTTVTRSFSMGTQFGVGGQLIVQAIGGDGTESDPYTVNFQVASVPPGMSNANLIADPGTGLLRYKVPTLRAGVPIEVGGGVEDDVIPEEIPLVGGKALKFLTAMDASAEVTGDGRARTTVDLHLPGVDSEIKPKIAGASIEPYVGGSLSWQYDGADWLPGGNVHFGANASIDVPPVPVYFPLGVCPLCVPAYWRGKVEVGVAQNLEVIGWAGPGVPWFYGTAEFDPFPGLEANLGVGVADFVAVEGYVGGGARLKLLYPYLVEPSVDDLKVYATGGVRLVALFFTYDIPAFTCTYDFIEDEGGCNWGDARGEPALRLYPRDYLDRENGYALFTANRYGGGSREVVNEEIPLQVNVFGQSTPDLAAMGDDLLAVWVYDDPLRTPSNRTEAVWSFYDSVGDLWSEPLPVADDGTADFHPQLAALPGGDLLMVWENVNDVVLEPGDPGDPCLDDCAVECADPQSEECLDCLHQCKYEEIKARSEIAVSRFDSLSQSWETASVITSNGLLDRSPRLAASVSGTAMLTWVSNADGDELGSAGSPNDLHYSLFDGLDWSAPADVALGVPSVVKSAMAYNGSEAVILFSGDTDGSNDTPEDRELFFVAFGGGSWGPVVQLTDDGPGEEVEDANPQVAYDALGNLLIAWYRGGDLVTAASLDPLTHSVVVDSDSGPSSGLADFRLAHDAGGRISLVWMDASEERSDLWSAIYDPALQVWTKAQQLTFDESMEHAMAPVLVAGGDLLVLYNKVQTVYETRWVDVAGEQVEVDNVPALDQSDLYLLRHQISGDLAMFAEDVSIEPGNPLAGQEVTISAVVRNLGDLPAVDIDVFIYDDDPGSNQPVGRVAIDGPLVGGDQAEVSWNWAVPIYGGTNTLYLVVDPALEQEDRDRTNNTALVAGYMQPDVAIDSMRVSSLAGWDRLITIRVLNTGALKLTGIDLRLLVRPAVGNTLIVPLSTTATLAPGAYQDLTWVLHGSPRFGGETSITVMADPHNSLVEADEGNNTRSILVSLPRIQSGGVAGSQ